ncbi:MAG: SIMPL domain-containing protein [Muribaculaceae bacterium]|nr:SIMPL domain-containing protein [Muribaculaceae bacterium]
MKQYFVLLAVLLLNFIPCKADDINAPIIEVSGSAVMNIVPDRITVEIGMEEYYKQKVFGDSIIVKLSEIEKDVRKTLREVGVADSLIVVSDLGNYRNREVSSTFLMAKRLSATVEDFDQLDRIADKLNRKGISSFNIVKIDNSNIGEYNRQGLKSALDAAREKAELIAENEGLKLMMPYEIVETTNELPGYSAFSNVAYDGGSGMENMRRIVRRYSVKVRYIVTTL